VERGGIIRRGHKGGTGCCWLIRWTASASTVRKCFQTDCNTFWIEWSPCFNQISRASSHLPRSRPVSDSPPYRAPPGFHEVRSLFITAALGAAAAGSRT
jgi:hypothetical protein